MEVVSDNVSRNPFLVLYKEFKDQERAIPFGSDDGMRPFDNLFRNGDNPSRLFILEFCTNDDAEDMIMYIVSKGYVFGGMLVYGAILNGRMDILQLVNEHNLVCRRQINRTIDTIYGVTERWGQDNRPFLQLFRESNMADQDRIDSIGDTRRAFLSGHTEQRSQA